MCVKRRLSINSVIVSRSSCADASHSSVALLIKNPPLPIHFPCEHAISFKKVSVHWTRVYDKVNRNLSFYVPHPPGNPLVKLSSFGRIGRTCILLQHDEQINVAVVTGRPPGVATKENDFLRVQIAQAVEKGFFQRRFHVEGCP